MWERKQIVCDFGMFNGESEFDVASLCHKLPSVWNCVNNSFIQQYVYKTKRTVIILQDRTSDVDVIFQFFPSTSTDAHSFHVVLGNRCVIAQVVRRRYFTSHVELPHRKHQTLQLRIMRMKRSLWDNGYLVWTFGISCHRIGHGTAITGGKLIGFNFFQQSGWPFLFVGAENFDFGTVAFV